MPECECVLSSWSSASDEREQDGWIVGSAIVWHKLNAIPQSVRDRLSNRYELIFLLVKQRTYWFDLDPIRQTYTGDCSITRRARIGGTKPNSIKTPWPLPGKYRRTGEQCTGERRATAHTNGKSSGDVLQIFTWPLRAAHFAAFPIDILLTS